MKRLVVIVALLGAASAARADEGMWTFDNFPAAQVKQKYGFEPMQAWLDQVRLASARIGGGCSASFVSPEGLVMTNHHCARGCIQQLSTAELDYLAQGFSARTQADERQCPAMEMHQLLEITDVTGTLNTATQGLTGKAYGDTLKAEMARLEKDCATGEELKCSVVTLYQGGRYHLYKYRRYQDVRLVFAPEHAVAFFGGDPDNFEFPRYDLDVTFLRVYEGGKPAKTPHYFKWSRGGPKEGELTFISGNPGRTSRGLTVAQLEYERDVSIPRRLLQLAEARGMLTEFQNRGPEQKRTSSNLLFTVENSLKALKGHHAALLDREFFASKVAAEQELRRRVAADPKLQEKYGTAWDEIARALETQRTLHREYNMIEEATGSQLLSMARTLVRAADELPKPNSARLREFTEANLPTLKALLLSRAPIYPELEIARLTYSFTKLREELGVDHPYVKKVLGRESPMALATRLVNGTGLMDVKLRQQLLEGGRKAIDGSQDPLIRLATLMDPDGRAIRQRYEEQVESVLRKNGERVAQARFDVYGTQVYPDATFSPRLSYGAIKGYVQEGRKVEPFTRFAGSFERHTGEDPFALPKTWLDAQKALTPDLPLNFVSTNDIIGGNSGSPVINKEREIVGLVFDGNRHSLGGEYGFDENLNRAVSLHSEAILEALRKVYRAERLLQELRPASNPAAKVRPAG
jgi:hypothetical protein